MASAIKWESIDSDFVPIVGQIAIKSRKSVSVFRKKTNKMGITNYRRSMDHTTQYYKDCLAIKKARGVYNIKSVFKGDHILYCHPDANKGRFFYELGIDSRGESDYVPVVIREFQNIDTRMKFPFPEQNNQFLKTGDTKFDLRTNVFLKMFLLRHVPNLDSNDTDLRGLYNKDAIEIKDVHSNDFISLMKSFEVIIDHMETSHCAARCTAKIISTKRQIVVMNFKKIELLFNKINMRIFTYKGYLNIAMYDKGKDGDAYGGNLLYVASQRDETINQNTDTKFHKPNCSFINRNLLDNFFLKT